MASKLYSQRQRLKKSPRAINKTRISKQNSSNREIGSCYEQAALDYLLKRGLSFISRNFQVHGGEIDLIMQDAETLVFVEVKYRSKSDYGMPFEAVDKRKMQRIHKTAMLWMAKHGLAIHHCYFRFDIISIKDGNNIQWLKNIMLEGYKAN